MGHHMTLSAKTSDPVDGPDKRATFSGARWGGCVSWWEVSLVLLGWRSLWGICSDNIPDTTAVGFGEKAWEGTVPTTTAAGFIMNDGVPQPYWNLGLSGHLSGSIWTV